MSRGYFKHRGVTFPRLLYTPRGLEAARDFPVLDDDVFNVTYQKSGTVWMLEILSLIRCRGDPGWCQSVPNWDRGPWLETVPGLRRARGNPRPRLISSHLPLQLFPSALRGSKAKVIYTVRNPKDVLVSLYHFSCIFRPYRHPGTMEQFLTKFLEGDVPFGSWFDHVRGWLQLLGQENFFCITYEELQQDLRGSVQRLCSFLGEALGAAQLEAVVANCSFSAMRSNPMSNFSLSPPFILDLRRGTFLRKGISGDWKNHLSAEQSLRFDRVYRERMAGLGVAFPWDPPPDDPLQGTPPEEEEEEETAPGPSRGPRRELRALNPPQGRPSPSPSPSRDPPSLTPPHDPPNLKPTQDPPTLKPTQDPPILKPPQDPPTLKPAQDPPSLKPTEDPPTLSPTQDLPPQDPPTLKPTQDPPTLKPTQDPPMLKPTQDLPTLNPTQDPPTLKPTQDPPTLKPTQDPPMLKPTQDLPTQDPPTLNPTQEPLSLKPT